VIGASTGLFGAVWAQAETRKVLGIIGADIDGELPVGQADGAFDHDGHSPTPACAKRLIASSMHSPPARGPSRIRRPDASHHHLVQDNSRVFG
jgi:hypothetical protein